MRIVFATLLPSLLASLAINSPAHADPSPTTDVTRMVTDDCAKARKQNKTCVLTIEDETIDGTGATAGQPTITIREFTQMGSLIRLRRDFIAEILRTAEDL